MAAERFSSKRYGVRYGRTLRKKVGILEQERRSDNICPHCRYKSVERVASGIWLCNKCKGKFTGRAYRIGKKLEKEVEGGIAVETAKIPAEAEAPVSEG